MGSSENALLPPSLPEKEKRRGEERRGRRRRRRGEGNEESGLSGLGLSDVMLLMAFSCDLPLTSDEGHSITVNIYYRHFRLCYSTYIHIIALNISFSCEEEDKRGSHDEDAPTPARPPHRPPPWTYSSLSLLLPPFFLLSLPFPPFLFLSLFI